MNFSQRFLLPGLLACVAMATLGFSELDPQGRLAVQPVPGAVHQVEAVAVRPHWPPQPDHLFNLDIDGAVLSPTGELVVFDVPSDRWLVVTHFTASSFGTPFDVVERVGSTDTVKVSSGLTNHGGQDTSRSYTGGPVGLTFQPGSQVVLRNRSNPPTPGYPEFHVAGYLVDV